MSDSVPLSCAVTTAASKTWRGLTKLLSRLHSRKSNITGRLQHFQSYYSHVYNWRQCDLVCFVVTQNVLCIPVVDRLIYRAFKTWASYSVLHRGYTMPLWKQTLKFKMLFFWLLNCIKWGGGGSLSSFNTNFLNFSITYLVSVEMWDLEEIVNKYSVALNNAFAVPFVTIKEV